MESQCDCVECREIRAVVDEPSADVWLHSHHRWSGSGPSTRYGSAAFADALQVVSRLTPARVRQNDNARRISHYLESRPMKRLGWFLVDAIQTAVLVAFGIFATIVALLLIILACGLIGLLFGAV